ncbi:hypothetical protein GQ42DRAFT_163340 [Ramicandelaber brevisporus]|nr:hypothetical protein GQ42DRAFT_163340 [Ramicandelaber brevisporus]
MAVTDKSSSSLLLFGGYILCWLLVVGTFVKLYHRRNQKRLDQLESWFPPHQEREIYHAMLEAPSEDVDDHALKAALVRRAMTDVRRLVELQQNKEALEKLVKSGAIGDEMWGQFTTAENELQAEMLDVVNEANSFDEGWGQHIFQMAVEYVGHERIRELRTEMYRVGIEDGKNIAERVSKPSVAPPMDAPITQEDFDKQKILAELIAEDEANKAANKDGKKNTVRKRK